MIYLVPGIITNCCDCIGDIVGIVGILAAADWGKLFRFKISGSFSGDIPFDAFVKK